MASFLRALGLISGGDADAANNPSQPLLPGPGAVPKGAPGSFENPWPSAEDWGKAGLRTTKPITIRLPDRPPTDGLSHGGKASLAHHFKKGTGMHRHGGINQNFAHAVVLVLIPPAIFTFVSWALCFEYHYTYPTAVWAICCLGFVPVFVATQNYRRNATVPGADTRWNKLTIILYLVAIVAGMIAGEGLFWFFFHPYYMTSSMKVYTNISPANVVGPRLMDAGVIQFSEDARLATEMGMSFVNYDTYCVAPITSPNAQVATYDLWAVGVNCCRSDDPIFRCGEYRDRNVRAGLRQVSEEHRLFFRLAVEQAEAAYGIQAEHPLFFYWVKDPVKASEQFYITGFKQWLLSTMLHFVLNAGFIVVFFMGFRPNKAPTSLNTLGQN